MTDEKKVRARHNIVAFEQDFLEDGEIVFCSCGARSPRGEPAEGRAWHQRHKKEQAARIEASHE